MGLNGGGGNELSQVSILAQSRCAVSLKLQFWEVQSIFQDGPPTIVISGGMGPLFNGHK